MPINTNRIFLQRTTALETKYGPRILKTIKDFRASFISNYKQHGYDYAVQRLQLTSINQPLTDLLRALYIESGVMGATLTARELKALAGRKAGGFGTNQAWIDVVVGFLKLHLLRFVAAITETMREDILRILAKAVEENLSINDTVKALQEDGLMKARARVIARTEIVRAANVGHAVAAQDTPYEVLKKWSAAKDHRTRHSHRDMNGKAVDELEAFQVPVYDGAALTGYVPMQYPGDATAPPAQTINCRCRVVYVPKTDSEGNLIMRRQATQATVIPMTRVPTQTPAQIAAILKSRIVMRVD